MNDGKLEYEIRLDYNGAGGSAALSHVGKIKSAYMGLSQLLRGDIMGALFSANNAMSGFGGSILATVGKLSVITGTFLTFFEAGKRLDSGFGLSDKIAAAFVPVNRFNTGVRESLLKLAELNATKLDAVTKELNNMGEAAQTASAHALNLLALTNQANAAKAGTPEEQYKQTQQGSVDTLKELEKKREGLSKAGSELENEYLRRNNMTEGWGKLRKDAVARKDPDLSMYYRTEEDKSARSANDLIPAMLENKKALETLAKQMDVVGANMIKAGREMTEKKAADSEREKKATLDEAERSASEHRSSFSDYEKMLEADRKAAASAVQAKSDYEYDKMTPEQKLAVTQKKITEAQTAFSQEKDPSKRDDIKAEAYRTLLPERDRLKIQIEAQANKQLERVVDPTESRAANIQAARDNIAGSSRRQVGGDDLAGYFSRISDLRHGRTPKDDAAMQTVENTRIIAENTKVLAKLGVVKP